MSDPTNPDPDWITGLPPALRAVEPGIRRLMQRARMELEDDPTRCDCALRIRGDVCLHHGAEALYGRLVEIRARTPQGDAVEELRGAIEAANLGEMVAAFAGGSASPSASASYRAMCAGFVDRLRTLLVAARLFT